MFICVYLQWYELEAPEKVAFPLKSFGNLTAIRKLLLLRCFRVDRVFRALQDYVSETMGESSTNLSFITLLIYLLYCHIVYLLLETIFLTLTH